MKKRKSLLGFIIDFNLASVYAVQIFFAVVLSKITGEEIDSDKNKKRTRNAVYLFFGLMLLALFILIASS